MTMTSALFILSKYVRLGQAGDVLIAITTSGSSSNILKAIEAAHERDMTVIALTGKGGGKMSAALRETDVHICVPHDTHCTHSRSASFSTCTVCVMVLINNYLGEKESV